MTLTSRTSMPQVANDTSPISLASMPVVMFGATPFAEATPDRSSLPDAVSVIAWAAVSRRHIPVQGPASV